MRKILCIGEALIDMICTDKGKSLADGENFLKKPGGAPTNVAAAIAALGGDVGLLARVGKDAFGRQLIRVMDDFGVDTGGIFVDEHQFTTFAFVSLMEDGERDFLFNRGADEELTAADVESVGLEGVGIVHFGSATAFLPGALQEAYYRLLKMAVDAGVAVSFDPNYRHLLFGGQRGEFVGHCWKFLPACDFFKVSDEEAMLLTDAVVVDEAVDRLKARTSAVFAVTLGKEGTLLRCGEEVFRVPSIAVKPVDTTGAGDAFVGAVLYQLSRRSGEGKGLLPGVGEADKAEWRNIVVNANKAGARTCEFMGAMEAFKHLNNSIFS